MKRIIATVAAIAALTGCTRVVEVEVPTEPAQTQPSSNNPTTYELYIDAVYRLSRYPIYVSDSDLYSGGLAVCDLLASGATSYDLASFAVDTVGDDEIALDMFSAIVAAAVTTICPEYEYKIAYEGV
jgi:hypothetical protein